ncbi:hypothetical protein [Caballeronia grimmiae]|uniref:hypothetical protein n=1 Tax=Caballeronia grimmiae TaxID=1071679 RepID=UPI0038B80237
MPNEPPEPERQQRDSTPAGEVSGTPTPDYHINDKALIDEIKRLKRLRSFLLSQVVDLKNEAPPMHQLGELNLLTYRKNGRSPFPEEWLKAESAGFALFEIMSPEDRKKFRASEIPFWVGILTVALVLLALTSCVFAMVEFSTLPDSDSAPSISAVVDASPLAASGASASSSTGHASAPSTASSKKVQDKIFKQIVVSYVIWLVSLGAIGAVAFVGMNALALQRDITFELNSKLISLRIVLGALFGVVLTLPFGFSTYWEFLAQIRHKPTADNNIITQTVWLLLPFLFGFSTSLVIAIVNRLNEGIQAIFGIRAETKADENQQKIGLDSNKPRSED